jgi:drug/metabolite transporter (DMT)-like permease
MNKTLGIILTVAGIAMLIWGGFSYTRKVKVIDAGPIQISADKQENVNWPPFVGGIILVAGIVLIVTAKKD